MGLFNYTDPNDYFPYGEAVSDFGICVPNETNGLGLATRGLIWQAYDVWFDSQAHDALATSWANSQTAITTTWSAVSSQSVTTTWTPVQGGVWGEVTP